MFEKVPLLTTQQMSWLRFTLTEEINKLKFISADTVHDALIFANLKMNEYKDKHQ